MPLFIKGRQIEVIAPFSSTGLTVATILYNASRTPTNGTAVEIGTTANYYQYFTPDTVGDWRLVFYSGTEKHVFYFAVYDHADITGTTTLANTTETQAFEVAKTGIYNLSIYLDMSAMVNGGTITVRLYNKIDGTNYRVITTGEYIVGTTTDHPVIEVNAVHHNCKVTLQCSTTPTSHIVTHRYITLDLGA